MGISKVKAVFLDRDGVINHTIVRKGKPYPPKDLSEFKFLANVIEGITLLKNRGFLTIIVTNQPDVGRGTITKENVELIHAKIKQSLLIDEIRVCYDDGEKVNSEFRKPNPGMIFASAKENNIDLTKSFMVGDRWKDIEAGKRAGLKTFFVDYGYREVLLNKPDYQVASLLEAVRLICSFNIH